MDIEAPPLGREPSETGDSMCDAGAEHDPAVERRSPSNPHPGGLGELIAERAGIAALEGRRQMTRLWTLRLVDDLESSVAKPAQEIEG